MKKGIDFCLVLVILLMASCKNTGSPSAYVKALKEDQKLNKTVTIGEVDYTFRILTPELMALKASANEDHKVNTLKYKQRLAEVEGYLFVNIEMQLHDQKSSVLKYNLKDAGEYDQRVMYYEFGIKNDLKLNCDGSEIPPQSYQYENHLDLMPYNTMVVAFPLCRDSKDFQILLNDRALNNLFIKVNFKQDDINSLPKLTLN